MENLTGWLEYSAEGLYLTLERVLERMERLAAKETSGKIVLTPKQGAMKILNPLIASGLIHRIGTRKSGKYVVG